MPDLGTLAGGYDGWHRETPAELLDLLAEGRLKSVVAEHIPLVDVMPIGHLKGGKPSAG